MHLGSVVDSVGGRSGSQGILTWLVSHSSRPGSGGVHLHRDAGADDQHDQGQQEEDAQPVGGGPVVPGLSVDPDLTHWSGVVVSTWYSSVGQVTQVISPADHDAESVSCVLQWLVNININSDLFIWSKPNPAARPRVEMWSCDSMTMSTLPETDSWGQHILCSKQFPGLVLSENVVFTIIVDTQQMSILFKTLGAGCGPVVHVSLQHFVTTVGWRPVMWSY